jgi:two-component system, response regulator YesN
MYRLLIVEDVKTVREAISLSIDWASLGIVLAGTAENGAEALERIEEWKPDILLTDIGMPRMNGIDLITHVMGNRPDTKCIILSGLNEFEHARQALKLHVMDYVLKPVDPDEIRRVVRRAADMIRKEREEREGLDMASQLAKEKLPNLTEQLPLTELGGNAKKKKLVDQALEYVRQHFLQRELSLSDIAYHIGLSEKYLNQIFKQVTGLTLNHTVIRMRMEAAADLLRDPNTKIYEICDQIGYADQDHFRESFKKQYGLTPTEFRNKYL